MKTRKKTTRKKRPARAPVTTSRAGDRYLGGIRTTIVGTQYCDVSVRPGEIVHFEREYDNEHDANAIRVENDDFAPVGHLPRREARWIAPLLDGGKLKIAGHVPKDAAPGRYDAPIVLDLHLTRKGSGMLSSSDRCATEAQALHETVLAAYERSAAWRSRRAVTGVARRLTKSLGRDALPDTYLVLKLFEVRAEELSVRRRTEEKARIRETIRSLRVGKAAFFDGLTLFPLFGKRGHRPDYDLLADALREETAAVTEISAEGRVGELKVVNRGTRPILIPEGEIIMGGKQNRVINITVIVEPCTEFIVPVSCVEQGRWGDRGDRFRTSYFAAPSLRSVKAASVHASMRSNGTARSDQGEVWRQVDASLAGVGADSPTCSLPDGYAKATERLEGYRRAFDLEEGAIGFLAARGDRILGAELFDAPETLATLWPRLSESYFLESVIRRETEATGNFAHAGRVRAARRPGRAGNSERPTPKPRKALRRTATDFLEALSVSTVPAEGASAWPGQLAVEMETHIGGGLFYDDRICHLGVFHKPTGATGEE